MRWLKYIIFLSGVLLVAQLSGTSSVYATSGYDDVIKLDGSAKVTLNWTASGGQCSLTSPMYDDISMNWSSIIHNPSRYYSGTSSQANTIIAAFDAAVSSGSGWALVQNSAQSNYFAPPGGADLGYGDSYTTLYFSDSSTATFNLVGSNRQLNMQGSSYAITIAHSPISGCPVGVTGILHSTLNPGLPIQDAAATSSIEKSIFVNFNIVYPSGYTGETPPISMPASKYIAMGDSFSSGEGNPLFEEGSDTNTDSCHRSPKAYPRLLEFDSSLNLGRTSFVACSGATTSEVFGGQNGEPPQIDALSADTQTVTITIGGNDVGFASYAQACTLASCGPNTFSYNNIIASISNQNFTTNLISTYESIISDAPNADIYVIGYPYLSNPSSSYCGLVDLSGAYSVQSQLNSVIAAAVGDAAANYPTIRLHYVDPNSVLSPFANRYLCNGGSEDFNGIDTQHPNYSFHPNQEGHEDFASVIKNAL